MSAQLNSIVECLRLDLAATTRANPDRRARSIEVARIHAAAQVRLDRMHVHGHKTAEVEETRAKCREMALATIESPARGENANAYRPERL
jgi:hypothetical protein